MVTTMVKKAFLIGKQRKEEDSVYRIQRILRGHIERAGKEKLILESIKTKVQLK
jgi:hypothetical protein